MVTTPLYSAEEVERQLKISLTEHQKNYFKNRQLNKYVYPRSNRQISTLLVKFNKPAMYFRLCQLICKFKKSWDFAGFTYTLLKKKNATDTEIYEAIFRDTPKEAASSVLDFSKEFVAEYLVTIFKNLELAPTSLLDIGCGNCIMTRDLGKALGIDNANVYGADVPGEFELKWAESRPREIKFVEIRNNKLKFNRKFDLITCMMVLHHVPESVLMQYIKDIFALLNSGGIFVIKEHDCFNAADYIIADVEHSLYIAKEAFALRGERKLSAESQKRIFEQKMEYKDRFTWRIMMQQVGFKCIHENIYDTGLSNTYAPNRAYLAIFKRD